MIYTALSLSAVALFAAAKQTPIANFANVSKINPDTVDELDVNAYAGYWYQMAADAIVYATFEKDSFCDTALYGLNADGTISVHNYAKVGSPSGSTYTIDGYAYVPNANEPGQLKVHFDADEAAPFDAPYWVLALGPKNSIGLYDWSIVSDNLSAFLFVLARDVETFNAQYKTDVYALLTELGFTGRTAPIDTYHGADCVYEEQKLSGTPNTVDELIVESYLGLWYNMYTDKFSDKTAFKGGKCPTAVYSLRDDGKISVHNYETIGAATDGSTGTDTIDGYAYVPNAQEPGQLLVSLEGMTEVPYWVTALGPVNKDGLYDYAIVTDNVNLSLFVLARDVDDFNAKYDAEVQKLLKDMGFDGLYTTPIVTYQGSDCVYE